MDRPNLRYVLHPSNIQSTFKLPSYHNEMVYDEVMKQEGGSGIIYCATKIRCEELSNFLKSKGIDSEFYHAGIKSEDTKSEIHQSW
jgi:ATP-dependent DNA helicase RecQ